MKQKRWMVLMSMALGGLMIFGVAFASASGTSGYEVYKTALKNTRAAASMTGQVKVSAVDNGNTIVNLDGSAKMNREAKTMSGAVTAKTGNVTSTSEVYQQDGKVITKASTSDVYNVMERHPGAKQPKPEGDRSQLEQKYAQDVENLIDAVVGNIKNDVTLNTNADGSKEVSLQLSGNQIPAPLNAIASLAIKSGLHERANEKMSAAATAIKNNLPQLTDGITLSNIDIKAVVDDQDLIKSQQVILTVSGKDASGASHEVVVTIDLNLSNINQTTPDSIDLTGKQVKTMQPGGRHWEQD